MFSRIEREMKAREGVMTWILLGAGLALIAVALFGKAEHKAAVLIYVALP
jgi:hypothetical protein